VHGAALGADEPSSPAPALEWSLRNFEVPQPAYDHCAKQISRGQAAESRVDRHPAPTYRQPVPQLKRPSSRGCCAVSLPQGWEATLPSSPQLDKPGHPPVSYKLALNADRPQGALPELIGGSADLTHSKPDRHQGERPASRRA